MKRTLTVTALAAVVILLALPLLAAPAGATSGGATPPKKIVQKLAPIGVRASGNDLCTDATIIAALPYTDTQDTTGNTTDATIPTCSGGAIDEWYTFTPSSAGYYYFGTCGSAVDTIMALYTGTCGALTQVTCSDDLCGLQSSFVVDLAAGTQYYIQILGYKGETGSITFNVDANPAAVSVQTSFNAAPSGTEYTWGCGYSDTAVIPTRAPGTGGVWTADYYTLAEREFSTAGAPLGITYSGMYWADMEYDAARGVMYQMNIPNASPDRVADNCIHTWYPATGAAGTTICDPANVWTANEQQAVAYDPATDTLYVGGWNAGTIYHVAGLSSTAPPTGTILASWPMANVSGLAWLCDGTLAAVVSEPRDRVYILDPANSMAILRSYTLPNPSGYVGAGIDAQPDGPAWIVNQNDQRAYLVDLEAVCPTCSLMCTADAAPAVGDAPLTVTFTATATPTSCTGTPTFAWDFGDGGSSTDQNPAYTYSTAGTYTWILTVTVDSITCTQTGYITVNVPACSLTCLASATPTSGQLPLAVTFTATAKPASCAGTPTFAWVFGDGGTSTDQNPSHTYTAAGTYTWTLTVTVDGVTCTQTGTISVTAPAFDVYLFDDYSRSQLCLNSATGNFTYTILRGIGAGMSFTGTAILSNFNGVLRFTTPLGLPYSFTGSYLSRYHKGSASYGHRPLRINSTLYDSNTLNDPPGGCGVIPSN